MNDKIPFTISKNKINKMTHDNVPHFVSNHELLSYTLTLSM